MAVQTCSALLAGLTSATLTNGLDVVKTRLQVAVLSLFVRLLCFGGHSSVLLSPSFLLLRYYCCYYSMLFLPREAGWLHEFSMRSTPHNAALDTCTGHRQSHWL